jgi:hypothetical protein
MASGGPSEIIKRLAEKQDKRRFQRVRVNVLGRFMLSNRREYPCQVVDMSPGGVRLMVPVTGEVGERVVAYIDHIGRVEGEIARLTEGGFAMTLVATPRKRDKLAAQLTWLANRHELNLPEDRRHERIIPKTPFSQITLSDGRLYRCRIMDVSLSGAALDMDVRPAVGAEVQLGRMRARVVRHLETGIAVEFATLQSEEQILDSF